MRLEVEQDTEAAAVIDIEQLDRAIVAIVIPAEGPMEKTPPVPDDELANSVAVGAEDTVDCAISAPVNNKSPTGDIVSVETALVAETKEVDA